MGDLVLTCMGDLSRNRRVGLALGQGRALAEITGGMVEVAEGIRTTYAACALADLPGADTLTVTRSPSPVVPGRSLYTTSPFSPTER